MINKIAIDNFRGFASFCCDGFAPVTVIGGRNNAGKSSFLEAIALTLDVSGGGTLLDLERGRGHQVVQVSDMNMLFHDGNEELPASVESSFDDGGRVRCDIVHKTPNLIQSGASLGASMPVNSFRQAMEEEDRLEIHASVFGGRDEASEHHEVFYVFGQGGSGLAVTQSESPQRTRGRCVFPCLRGNGWGDLLSLYKRGEADVVAETLRMMDTRVLDAFPIDGQIYVKVQGVRHRVPLTALGDGAVKIAMSIALVASVPNGGVCAFDEVENGLHYSAMHVLWRTLVNVARQRGVQLIATTHSLEMLHAMEKVAAAGDAADFAYLRIATRTDGRVVYTKYGCPEFTTHLEEDFELR